MRRLLFPLLLLVLLPGLLLSAAAAGTVSVLIDGTPVVYSDQYGYPYVDGADRTQVPFRLTMETLGCQVDWDGARQTAIARKDGSTVEVPIGKPWIFVDGEQRTIDTAAVLNRDRTYLPIRAVAEAFGGQVEWDGEGRRVLITSCVPLKIHFIDVGQGDATLIDMGATEVLIDGGPNSAGKTVVNYLRPYVDGVLDYVIATHSDADHVGGLDNVLAAYAVGEVIDSGRAATTKTYQDYRAAALSEPGCILSQDEDRRIRLAPGAQLYVIETGDGWSTPNDSSVVCQLVYRDVRALFTGDISETVEAACLSLFSPVDILKVGHHGSATSSGSAFLSVVRPKYAVVSYAAGNDYHHPTAAALRRLMDCGAAVYGTGKSGSIVLTTDGFSCQLSPAAPLTMEDAGDEAGAVSLSSDSQKP